MLGCAANWSRKSSFSLIRNHQDPEKIVSLFSENQKGSWCKLVSNLARISGPSQLHVFSRICGLPDQDPDVTRMESRVLSEENLVSNPDRIQETSQLHASTRNCSFPQEKRAIPRRNRSGIHCWIWKEIEQILTRVPPRPSRKSFVSVTVLDQKLLAKANDLIVRRTQVDAYELCIRSCTTVHNRIRSVLRSYFYGIPGSILRS